jgi:hypothetical protein
VGFTDFGNYAIFGKMSLIVCGEFGHFGIFAILTKTIRNKPFYFTPISTKNHTDSTFFDLPLPSPRSPYQRPMMDFIYRKKLY